MVGYESLFVMDWSLSMAMGKENAQKNVHDALFYVHNLWEVKIFCRLTGIEKYSVKYKKWGHR